MGISNSGLYLKKEYRLVKKLKKREGSKTYLPQYHLAEELDIKGQKIYLVLSEWLEGYYEWHITEDGSICIWDMDNGYFIASPKQRLSIYEKSSHILTYYFDPATFFHIYPWHHSAGDFVVRYSDSKVELKLTSVRDYNAIVKPKTQYDVALITSMVYFFLNMSIKMRLDKKNGVGEVVFAPDDILGSVLKGFLSGLNELISINLLDREHRNKITALLSSLTHNELSSLFYSMLDHYDKEDAADISVIANNARSHINSLYHVLQKGLQ